MLKKSVLLSFDDFFRHACKCETIVKNHQNYHCVLAGWLASRKMKSENSWETGCQESEMDRVKKILPSS